MTELTPENVRAAAEVQRELNRLALSAEVVRLRALLNPVENWHGVVKGNNE